MASSPSPSEPAPPRPSPPSPPELAAPAPLSEARPKPKPSPTIIENVRALLRSGDSFLRSAFSGNSGQPAPPRPPAPLQQQHHSRPGEIMKRLQRETFPDVMKLMDRHEQIERILSAYRSGKGFHLPELPVRVKVALDAAGALFLVDDGEFEQARGVLAKAGSRMGLSSRFVLESRTRGRDTVAVELSSRIGAGTHLAAGRPLELTRLQYCAHITDWLTMTLVPFGAQCNNFLHGSSLVQNLKRQTVFEGPPSFSEQHNCAAGVSIRGAEFTASIAELIYGSDAQHESDHAVAVANRLTTFAQVSYEPADDVKLSASALWQVRPASSRFSHLGTLAVPLGSLKMPTKALSEAGSSVMVPLAPAGPMVQATSTVMVHGPPPAMAAAPESRASQSVAVMVDCELYESTRAEGWLEIERPSRNGGRGHEGAVVQWGLCLMDTPDQELGWGVRMGGTAAGEKHLEGFLSFNLGNGGKLQPGVIYAMDGPKATPALVLRSSWFI